MVKNIFAINVHFTSNKTYMDVRCTLIMIRKVKNLATSNDQFLPEQ